MPAEEILPSLPMNFLRPCVLLLLRESPAHGYELLEQLAALGFPRTDPGRLYRTLRTLEEDRRVRSAWEPSSVGPDRRIYELTRPGMEELHSSAQALAAGRSVLGAFLARYEEFVALEAAGRRAVRADRLVSDV